LVQTSWSYATGHDVTALMKPSMIKGGIRQTLELLLHRRKIPVCRRYSTLDMKRSEAIMLRIDAINSIPARLVMSKKGHISLGSLAYSNGRVVCTTSATCSFPRTLNQLLANIKMRKLGWISLNGNDDTDLRKTLCFCSEAHSCWWSGSSAWHLTIGSWVWQYLRAKAGSAQYQTPVSWKESWYYSWVSAHPTWDWIFFWVNVCWRCEQWWISTCSWQRFESGSSVS